MCSVGYRLFFPPCPPPVPPSRTQGDHDAEAAVKPSGARVVAHCTKDGSEGASSMVEFATDGRGHSADHMPCKQIDNADEGIAGGVDDE